MTARCPKCEGSSFSYQTSTLGGKQRLIIHCSSCGCAIGVLDKD